MNLGGHNSVHNIFLLDILYLLFIASPLPTPVCQQLLTGRDLCLWLTGTPRT